MWSGAPGEVRGDGQCYGNKERPGSTALTTAIQVTPKGSRSTMDPVGPNSARVSRRSCTQNGVRAAAHPRHPTKNPVATLTAGLTCITKYSEPYSHATSIADVKQYLVRCAV